MRLTINGEQRDFGIPLTVDEMLEQIGMDPRKVAVERNLEVVPKSRYQVTSLNDGDRIEIVHFIGGGAPDDVAVPSDDDTWEIAGHTFHSRLIV
jgi:thiazole synthase